MRLALNLEKIGPRILPKVQDELSDEEILIQKAKNFDSEAWTQIYRQNHPKIYAYLRYRLNDIDLAEDMAATVFLHAVDKIESFTYRGFSLSSWLFRIAHNLMVDHFRRKGKVAAEPLTEALLAKSGGLDRTMESALIRADIDSALNEITDEQKHVVLLKFFGGLSNAEVARVIKKPEGAVKALQHRALASLRRVLEKGEENGERL